MNKSIVDRIKKEADYIINTKATIRKVAKKFGNSKSTVHKDMQERLSKIDQQKYNLVQNIFQSHTEIRHILGGQSTKYKYEQLKKNNER